MTLRSWSVAQLIRRSLVAWLCAAAMMFLDIVKTSDWSKALFFLLLATPPVLLAAWLLNRAWFARWHVGKIIILWAVSITAGQVALTVSDEEGIRALVWMLLGPPLVSITWTWLSARENPPTRS